MKKRFSMHFRIGLIAMLAAILLPVFCFAYSSGIYGDYTWTLDDAGTLTISVPTDPIENPVYDDEESPWYNIRGSIREIIIGSGITYINPYHFRECSNLETIIVDASNKCYYSSGNCIISTGYGSEFYIKELILGCKNSVIPSGVKYIGQSAFRGCSKLTSISIPSSVEEIEHFAFSGCSSLKSIELPSSVNVVGRHSFEGCTSLTSINIPFGVRQIEHFAFYKCKNLKTISMPLSLKKIRQSAFEGCRSLSAVVYEGTKAAWDNVFIEFGNEGIFEKVKFTFKNKNMTLNLPSKLTKISASAFKGNTAMIVSIPSGCTSIGTDAFAECPNLTTVYLPASLEGKVEDCFSNSSGYDVEFIYQ